MIFLASVLKRRPFACVCTVNHFTFVTVFHACIIPLILRSKALNALIKNADQKMFGAALLLRSELFCVSKGNNITVRNIYSTLVHDVRNKLIIKRLLPSSYE